MKVLYIASVPKSGSTILGNILGELDGFFCCGELCFLEKALRGSHCGCGSYFGDCPLWSEILGDGSDRLDLAELELDPRRFRARSLPVTSLAAVTGLQGSDARRYVRALARLYGRVEEATRCRVLVDTSKSPTYGYLLAGVPGIELYVVHLVRDPRATAFSWPPAPDECDDNPLLLGPIWTVWNAVMPILSRRAVRHCFVRYEDFVERPRETVLRLAALVGETADGVPFVTDDEVLLQPNHTISGNSNRFQTGVVPIRRDDRWRKAPTSVTSVITDLTTRPLRALLYAGRVKPSRTG